MQRKGIISLNIKSIRPHIGFTVFSLIFLTGTLLGSIFIAQSQTLTEIIAEGFLEYKTLRTDGAFWPLFRNSLLGPLPYYLAVFLCGTSFIGCVISPFVLAVQGFSYGCMAGYLYFTYKLDGIVFCALILIPAVLISAFGLIYMTKESFSFSYMLSGICIKNSPTVNIYSNFKGYCIKCALLLIFIIISTVIDMAASALFMRFFTF